MSKNREVHTLLSVACRIGQLMLENGAETYRVEQTIGIVCKTYKYKNCESSVIPTTITLSITTKDNETYSMIKRINSRTVNLHKVSLINDLSRRITTEKISLTDLNKLLDHLDNSPKYSTKTTSFFTALASAAFCLLFGGNFRDFFITFFIGFFLSYCSVYLSLMEVNGFFVNITIGFLASILALFSIKLGLGVHQDKIVIGSIMLLLPGISITNAIRDIIAGDLVSGMSRTVEAFLCAVAIALGTGVGFNIWLTFIGGI